ncbi:hypothetical protein [Metallosphaera sp.]|uniref:hypothetical protein n=1 Tax=Metallosphaera sp. TaxID=2020860 RepID=UPI00319E9861
MSNPIEYDFDLIHVSCMYHLQFVEKDVNTNVTLWVCPKCSRKFIFTEYVEEQPEQSPQEQSQEQPQEQIEEQTVQQTRKERKKRKKVNKAVDNNMNDKI